jgi:aspartate/methionine/tyrosine aminotransferase
MHAPAPLSSILGIRSEAENAPTSGIVDVFNYGRGRQGLIPLWVGEGDLPTPDFITDAAVRSMRDGETFYTYQRGIPELRAAIAHYHDRVYGGSHDPETFYVTSGGMPALHMASRLVAGTGDEVLVPTPAWPNFVGALTVNGATPVGVPMHLGANGWLLDFDGLEAAVTERTTAVVVNSPSNPTGWIATREDQEKLLSFARRRGLWIIADEIYGRFVYDPALSVGGRAPSFRDIREPADRILFVQTFSKNWAMTGWRLGWIEAPPALAQVIENLVQYTSSGTPVFIQRAGVAALEQGEDFVAQQIERAAVARSIVRSLTDTGLVELPPPAGAFYAFLRIKGARNSAEMAVKLIDEANVGLAPGSAFGERGEGYLRLCYARDPALIKEAVRRIAEALPRLVG